MSCLKAFYLIKSADLRQTRAGKNYLAFTFQDDSGEDWRELWDAQPHNVEAFTAGKVVHMKGRREVYNNTPQVNQITLRLLSLVNPMIQLISRSSRRLMSRKSVTTCRKWFLKLKIPVWQRIVRKLYTKYDKEFYS